MLLDSEDSRIHRVEKALDQTTIRAKKPMLREELLHFAIPRTFRSIIRVGVLIVETSFKSLLLQTLCSKDRNLPLIT